MNKDRDRDLYRGIGRETLRDRWTDRQIERQERQRKTRYRDSWKFIDRQRNGQGSIGRQVDGQIAGQQNTWIDGWLDREIETQIDRGDIYIYRSPGKWKDKETSRQREKDRESWKETSRRQRE